MIHNNQTQHTVETHTHPFNGPFSGFTQVSRYQKGNTNLDFNEARDSEWQWHQLGHMQVRTLLQTDNHASAPPLNFYWPDALPATQPTASKHRRGKTQHRKWNILTRKYCCRYAMTKILQLYPETFHKIQTS